MSSDEINRTQKIKANTINYNHMNLEIHIVMHQ